MNFDELPKDRPSGVLQADVYPALVKKAEIRTASTDGKEYLVVTLACTDPETGNATTVYDNFYSTDKPLNKYKLRQFLIAINCVLKGEFEIKDLPKIIVNKKLTVALKIEQNAGYAPRNTVDVFEDSIYYPVAATEQQFNATDALPDTEDPGGVEY